MSKIPATIKMKRLWIVKIILLFLIIKVNADSKVEIEKSVSDVSPVDSLKFGDLNDVVETSSDVIRKKKSLYYYTPVSTIFFFEMFLVNFIV